MKRILVALLLTLSVLTVPVAAEAKAKPCHGLVSASKCISKPNAKPGQFCAKADRGKYAYVTKYKLIACKKSGTRSRWVDVKGK